MVSCEENKGSSYAVQASYEPKEPSQAVVKGVKITALSAPESRDRHHGVLPSSDARSGEVA